MADSSLTTMMPSALLDEATLDRFLARACRVYADLPAFCCLSHSLSYAQIETLSLQWAAWLQDQGVVPGTRVAVMLPNLLQYPVAIYGILRAGGVVVNCNPLYTPHELEFQLRDAEAEFMLVLENFAHTVQQIHVPSLRHIIVTQVGDLMEWRGHLINGILRYWKKTIPAWHLPGVYHLPEVLQHGATLPFTSPSLGASNLAFLQYTGGTTGRSKGAMLTHGNLMANLRQADHWAGSCFVECQEKIVTALPLYHIFALTANCLLFWKLGATNLLIPNPRDIPAFVGALKKFRFTTITGVNTLFSALLDYPDFSHLDFSALKVTLGGGMAVQEIIAQRWHTLTGCPINQAYGLSETSPAVSIHPILTPLNDGTVGIPVIGTTVELRDDEGHPVPAGHPGEICIRGPQVMQGYWRQAEETRLAFWPDNFFRTGDMGQWTDIGHLKLLERKKDMIKVSGFNVYPSEIEEVLSHHPDIAEVAAIGVPDAHSGEAIKVFIVARQTSLDEATVRAYCHEQLTGYKCPRHIEFRSSLPHSPIGKILRRALRDPESATVQPE
ncbi:MAG: AMP-binding protein [Betaproteobacteria bacterium]|jgi:Acyl-CoA synthetases (AMP-forming)/AMP-acid ligases II|nr:AMP-binding protein [Betaproteobacteria bacterium]